MADMGRYVSRLENGEMGDAEMVTMFQGWIDMDTVPENYLPLAKQLILIGACHARGY